MEALTAEEARRWCSQGFGSLRVTNEDLLYYKTRRRFGFEVGVPSDFRRIALLCGDLVNFTFGPDFEGGLLWLKGWEFGVTDIVKVGWRTLESIRRAHGNLQSLEIAPAQVFRADEVIDLHAFLLYTMTYEWAGYLLPRNGGFFLDVRASKRIICNAATEEIDEKLFEHLSKWQPARNLES
ncbi:MAG TPA: hypothetical protein VHX60_14945 [Acidobacteriaceae bacterium]|jgi:hypothetical protein|nr:hypothetical protein [Acidobacteriaceae bacterium]